MAPTDVVAEPLNPLNPLDPAMALDPYSTYAALRSTDPVHMSALAWGEFLCAPLSEQERTLALRVVASHLPVRSEEAAEAARLFHETGRRLGSLHECVVAAPALAAGAELATVDWTDFARFEACGLDLAK